MLYGRFNGMAWLIVRLPDLSLVSDLKASSGISSIGLGCWGDGSEGMAQQDSRNALNS